MDIKTNGVNNEMVEYNYPAAQEKANREYFAKVEKIENIQNDLIKIHTRIERLNPVEYEKLDDLFYEIHSILNKEMDED